MSVNYHIIVIPCHTVIPCNVNFIEAKKYIYDLFSIEMLMPCLGLRMTSASKGMSEGLTVDLRLYFRKIDATRIFSSISANLK